jgi:glyoxylase-like metal-dependent hydrolase (beta-lactamase superfamily II)
MTDVTVLTDAEGTFATMRQAFGVPDDSAWWLPFNAFLARTPRLTVLVDTGVGPPGGTDPFLQDRAGRLLQLLAAAGVDPADVDLVVHTHLHVDHVGWNMVDGAPGFPNARYLAHRADYDNFTSKNPERRYVRDQLVALHATGRLELFDESFSPAPGVDIEHAPGHTAGHCIVTVGDTTFLGDLAVHELQLADPGVAYMFEEDPPAAAARRREILSRLAAAGGPVAVPHLGLGRIERAGEGFGWSPLAEDSGGAASN